MNQSHQKEKINTLHWLLTRSLSWSINKTAKFTSWAAFPLAGFAYGLTYAFGQDDALFENIFGTAALVALLAVIIRFISSYTLFTKAFDMYAEYFRIEKNTLPKGRYIHPGSVLVANTYDWGIGSIAAFGDDSTKRWAATVQNESLRVQLLPKHTGIRSSFLVFAFELPNYSPHIFVDSRRNNLPLILNRSLWALHYRLKKANKSQKLEGDFPNYFDVYAPANQQIEVLSILTPDVMERLKDKVNKFDIEIIDNRLHIICEHGAIVSQSPKELLSAIEAVYSEVLHQVKASGLKAKSKQKLQVVNAKVGGLFYGFSILLFPLFIVFITSLTLVGLIPGILLSLLISLLV